VGELSRTDSLRVHAPRPQCRATLAFDIESSSSTRRLVSAPTTRTASSSFFILHSSFFFEAMAQELVGAERVLVVGASALRISRESSG
jgi:hypothetical protein